MATHYPIWWHRHGIKIHVLECDPEKKFLMMGSKAADLRFRQLFVRSLNEGRWLVEWCIRQSPLESVHGTVLFTDRELALAFRLAAEMIPDESKHLASRYSADRAVQGKFIGKDEYLNIPCPGTGDNGDPNISLYNTNEIAEAVGKLLY
jgi:hypothetical protein